MLGFLFQRLTAPSALFEAITRQARAQAWYVECEIADSIDGRFAVLTTMLALAIVRLDQLGDDGIRLGVALTERFVTVMESEHRELGLGDPTLGKTVRKLVGALSRRVGLWREAVEAPEEWKAAAQASLYRESPSASAHAAKLLKEYWSGLATKDLAALSEGKIE